MPWESSKAITQEIDFKDSNRMTMDAIKVTKFSDLVKAIKQLQIKTKIDNNGNVNFIYCLEPEKFPE